MFSKHTHFRSQTGLSRESREIFLSNVPSNHEARDQREEQLKLRVSRGRSIHSEVEADAAMKSKAREAAESIGKTKVGFLNWLNHFCSSQSAIESNVRDRASAYADRMIKQSGLYVDFFMGNVFQRGKRSLMMLRHAQFEQEFVRDMQSHFDEKEKILQQDEALYGGLSAALAKQQVTVNIGSSSHRQAILGAISTLQAEFDGKVQAQETANQDVVDKFKQEAADADHLKNVLLKLGVIDSSTRLNDLLDRAGRGDTALYYLINGHPNLNTADNSELKQTLLDTAEKLRRHGSWWALGLNAGTSGWYRAFQEGKAQPVNGAKLFEVLQKENYARRIVLKIPGVFGGRQIIAEVEKKDRDGNYVLLAPPNTPLILDPNTHEVTYLTGGRNGRTKHVSLDDNPESIALAA